MIPYLLHEHSTPLCTGMIDMGLMREELNQVMNLTQHLYGLFPIQRQKSFIFYYIYIF